VKLTGMREKGGERVRKRGEKGTERRRKWKEERMRK
jgi:hypothetical protein